jgi:hypothetical protein
VRMEPVVSNHHPPKSKLTGGQKWMITGVYLLQIPSSLILCPLAAVFAITGIFVPLSFAMMFKDRWQGGGIPERADHRLTSPVTDGIPD